MDKPKKETAEEMLEEFITQQRKASQMGSGDDMFYEQQITDYVNKQKPVWIDFAKFVQEKAMASLRLTEEKETVEEFIRKNICDECTGIALEAVRKAVEDERKRIFELLEGIDDVQVIKKMKEASHEQII